MYTSKPAALSFISSRINLLSGHLITALQSVRQFCWSWMQPFQSPNIYLQSLIIFRECKVRVSFFCASQNRGLHHNPICDVRLNREICLTITKNVTVVDRADNIQFTSFLLLQLNGRASLIKNSLFLFNSHCF